jgi:hypothetical protein
VQPVVLVEHGGELAGQESAALLTAGGVGAAEYVQDRLDDRGPVGAEPAKDLGGDPCAFADQAEQEVFGAHIVVAQPSGFTIGQVQHLFGSGCERRLPGRRCGAAADDLLGLSPGLGRAYAQSGKDLSRDAVVDAEQAGCPPGGFGRQAELLLAGTDLPGGTGAPEGPPIVQFGRLDRVA